ncbi:MAG: hypothetical protein WBA74_00170 [Cyclobacteriaceae bacterium]
MMRNILVLLFVLAWCSSSVAQNRTGIKLIGKATKRSIQLRWAPDSPSAWQLANEYGYTVERVKLSENGKIVKDQVTKIISDVVLKPASQAQWEAAIDGDDYVAVAAQAIFGETFEVSEDFGSDIAQVVNKAKELENRYSFALFSADQSVQAATLSGLYLEDELIAPNTKYVYRVYANVPSDILPIDTGFVYLGMDSYKELPPIPDVSVQFDDHLAMISWDASVLEKVFNSFWVERSDDGGQTFASITDEPVVNTFAGDKPRTRMMFRLDSIPSNNTMYHYRVKGIDAFGEVGPPSEVVSGSGKPLFAYNTQIESHEIIDNQKVILKWSFPEEGNSLLKSFDLLRFSQKTKTYSIIREGISPTAREFTDVQPRATNYYVLAANDGFGRKNNSYPYLVQLEDSIPPSKPQGLTGSIDTAGMVNLRWNKNPEEDVFGYKLFKSNFANREFIEVPGPIIESIAYLDTIRIDNLTEKIYYKVQAYDYRFNPSDFSAAIELKKPDIIPPNPPLFTEIKSDTSGILIKWELSRSEDVERHLLYRRSDKEPKWTLVKAIETDVVTFYLDTNVKHRVAYAYTMIAVDDEGLESRPIAPVSLKWIDSSPYPPISDFYYAKDDTRRNIALSWSYNPGNVSEYRIYKSLNGNPFKLIETVTADVNNWNDRYSIGDTAISYRIMASFQNGDLSDFSKIVKVDF